MQALNIERQVFGAAALQFTGRLEKYREGLWRAATPHGHLWTRAAVSCLVQPAAGDVVALWAPDGGETFIIAVLERPSGTGVALHIQGDLDMRVSDGRFSVKTDKGIDLESMQEVHIKAQELSLIAKKWRSMFSDWLCVGRDIVTRTGAFSVIADTASVMADRLLQHSRQSLREVDELDQSHAGQMDYSAEQTMSLRARHTLVTADELVKADANQIHLG
jgi:Protein of unknown function (DUF3540)